jgi:hypothetical protein
VQIKPYTQKSEIPNSLIPWVSELESLGIRSKKLNELNDVYEVRNLVENIKQTLFQEYKSSFQGRSYKFRNNIPWTYQHFQWILY